MLDASLQNLGFRPGKLSESVRVPAPSMFLADVGTTLISFRDMNGSLNPPSWLTCVGALFVSLFVDSRWVSSGFHGLQPITRDFKCHDKLSSS